MKIQISLYEFYAMGINSLVQKSPWETGERVSSYYESFVYEQRLLALALLFLMGEEYVPQSLVKTMPKKYSAQVRNSVNISVFSRALKHHYRNTPDGDKVAQKLMSQMDSYVDIMRKAQAQQGDPIEAITLKLLKRVPPRDQKQTDLYQKRVEKIFTYVKELVSKSLSEKYTIV